MCFTVASEGSPPAPCSPNTLPATNSRYVDGSLHPGTVGLKMKRLCCFSFAEYSGDVLTERNKPFSVILLFYLDGMR